MPTTELGLTYLVAGGTSLVTPFNTLADAVDEGLGLQASDRRQNQLLSGISLAAGAGLSLNINITAPPSEAFFWQRGQRYSITAGTAVDCVDNATNFIYYDSARPANKFYAQASSVAAGTADVLVGVAITSGSSISAAYANIYSARSFAIMQNNSGITADVGHVAIQSLTNSSGFVFSSSGVQVRVIGTVMGQIPNGDWGPVQFAGRGWARVTGAVAVGDMLVTGPLLGIGSSSAAAGAQNSLAKACATFSGAGTSLIPVKFH